jgi:hypothetical protein
VQVECGHSLWRRVLRLPPPGACQVRIAVSPRGNRICWDRLFGSHRTVTTQIRAGKNIREYSGLGYIDYEVKCEEAAVLYRQVRMAFLGLPVPRSICPQVSARVTVDGERWRVAVEVNTAKGALICRYAGNMAADGCGDLAAAGAGEPRRV